MDTGRMDKGRNGSLEAAEWGAVAGVRTFTAPAFLSLALSRRAGPPARLAVTRALGRKGAPWIFGALALFELGADQWPRLPDRIAPTSLLGRVISGAVVGSALGRGRVKGGHIAIAATSAVASAFVTFWLRRAANRRLPNSLTGLVEDALVVGAGAALAARLASAAT